MEYSFNSKFAPVWVRFPRFLFRYVRLTESTLESLEQNYLWFSSPLDFNDPFDCRNVLDWNNTPDELEWFLQRNLRRVLPPDKITALVKKAAEQQGYGAELWGKMYSLRLKQIGICCFSDIPNNNLMWSHYADGHRGICLVFSTKSLLNCGRFSGVKVSYSNDVPKFNIVRERQRYGSTAQFNFRFDQTVYGTKTTDWGYEREHRLVSHTQGKNQWPNSALVGVIFGAKISQSDRKNLEQLLDHHHRYIVRSEELIDLVSNGVSVARFGNAIVEQPVTSWVDLDEGAASATRSYDQQPDYLHDRKPMPEKLLGLNPRDLFEALTTDKSED
jgi:hypothetical protein